MTVYAFTFTTELLTQRVAKVIAEYKILYSVRLTENSHARARAQQPTAGALLVHVTGSGAGAARVLCGARCVHF